jgi:hypothetical protein
MPDSNDLKNVAGNAGLPRTPLNSVRRPQAPAPPPKPAVPWGMLVVGALLVFCIVGGIMLMNAQAHRPSGNKPVAAGNTNEAIEPIQAVASGKAQIPPHDGATPAPDPVGAVGAVVSGNAKIPPARQTHPVPMDEKPAPKKEPAPVPEPTPKPDSEPAPDGDSNPPHDPNPTPDPDKNNVAVPDDTTAKDAKELLRQIKGKAPR